MSKLINGTTYRDATPENVAAILEQARQTHRRIIIEYGDGQTGKAWGDVDTGYIGRSTGTVKIPLSIYNNRTTGGPAILDHCIVRILTARGKRELYRHPTYHASQDTH